MFRAIGRGFKKVGRAIKRNWKWIVAGAAAVFTAGAALSWKAVGSVFVKGGKLFKMAGKALHINKPIGAIAKGVKKGVMKGIVKPVKKTLGIGGGHSPAQEAAREKLRIWVGNNPQATLAQKAEAAAKYGVKGARSAVKTAAQTTKDIVLNNAPGASPVPGANATQGKGVLGWLRKEILTGQVLGPLIFGAAMAGRGESQIERDERFTDNYKLPDSHWTTMERLRDERYGGAATRQASQPQGNGILARL